ncbi:MAG TPA: DUF192 domain-containing protein [Rhizomicrobium sp.]|jgi:hypothetical protein|nr:DUF192 domain-containing protein [Rhizomicrobium sp.]
MRASLLALFAIVALAGCSKKAETSPIGLPMETIKVDTDHGSETFQVEIAADDASREKGLMFRKSMEADHGMLFVFPIVEGVAFWMKNTVLPLDMVFIRQDGTISSVAANATPFSTQEIPATEPIKAVLELNGGRAEALGIVPGDVVHAKAFNNVKP